MLDKLLTIKADYDALQTEMSDSAVASDPGKFKVLAQKESQLRPVIELINKYQAVLKQIEGSETLLSSEKDPELLDLAKEELTGAKSQKETLEEQLKVALLPKDDNDDKNVILELRAGAGGEEAALFAAELSRMYMRYAEKAGFSTELMSKADADAGGIKEIIFKVIGQGVYSKLKYESGVHRVQRVPETESQGRVHTSVASVAVLPEAEEVDIKIDPNEIRIDVFRSQGCGGQSVNTTDSAVRITHDPTGLVVTCQDEKSQHKNKAKALSVLRSRLYQLEEDKQRKERGEMRASQVGTGDRNEKIRTYNFPQDRVTDHRIQQNFSNLPGIMDGDIEDIIEKITLEDQAKKLAKLEKIR